MFHHNTSFALSLVAWISDASIFSNSLMSATITSPFQIPSACDAHPRNIPGKTFEPNRCSLDRSLAEKKVVFDHCSTRDDRSVKWYSESPLVTCLLIRQEIWYVPQKAVTLHGIRPPCSSRPDSNSTADVPSLILRTALSAIQVA